jgi:hypothetical protein
LASWIKVFGGRLGQSIGTGTHAVPLARESIPRGGRTRPRRDEWIGMAILEVPLCIHSFGYPCSEDESLWRILGIQSLAKIDRPIASFMWEKMTGWLWRDDE